MVKWPGQGQRAWSESKVGEQGSLARPEGKVPYQGRKARLPSKAGGQGSLARPERKVEEQGRRARLPSKAGGQGSLGRSEGGQLCDNTPEKAVLSFNMLWSHRPYEVVMSFTRSKPDPCAVRKIGRNLGGTTDLTLPPVGGLSPTTARKGTAVILNRDPTAINRIPIQIPLD
ncbi:hypothetical protein Dimus_008567 [Dionaea muscipula]